MPIAKSSNQSWSKADCFNDIQTPQQNDSSASSSSTPTSTSLPIHCQSPFLHPRFDIEDGNPIVCPCCHLRRRSSERKAALHSPKYIHTAFDDCCSNFCPDLSLDKDESSPSTQLHRGHSRLCEELQIPYDLASDQDVNLKGSFPGTTDASDGKSESNDSKN
jgi:hypothetical protein